MYIILLPKQTTLKLDLHNQFWPMCTSESVIFNNGEYLLFVFEIKKEYFWKFMTAAAVTESSSPDAGDNLKVIADHAVATFKTIDALKIELPLADYGNRKLIFKSIKESTRLTTPDKESLYRIIKQDAIREILPEDLK